MVVDGRIKYVRDGYTTSSNYPYAQRIDLADAARRNELGSRGVESIGNYIRNSVKAVVDAYTGEVTLYAFDEKDPILKAWRKAFPDLFAAKGEIPESLNEHLRYPEDLFSIQTWIYASYHIGNPDDFYSKEDFWALPDDRSGEIRRQDDTGGLTAATSVKARPYYLLTKLPERDCAGVRPGHAVHPQRQGEHGLLPGRRGRPRQVRPAHPVQLRPGPHDPRPDPGERPHPGHPGDLRS